MGDIVVFEQQPQVALTADMADATVQASPHPLITVGTDLVEHHGTLEGDREVMAHGESIRHGAVAVDMPFVVIGHKGSVRGFEELDDHAAGIAVLVLTRQAVALHCEAVVAVHADLRGYPDGTVTALYG